MYNNNKIYHVAFWAVEQNPYYFEFRMFVEFYVWNKRCFAS